MKHVNGSLIVNTLSSQCSEFIADAMGGGVYSMMGPKVSFFGMFTLSATGSVLLMLFWDNLSLVPVFITMAKFGISACFNMVFIASVQLIPTKLTGTVFGYSNVLARSITVLAPIVAEINYPTPLIINIATALVAAVASMQLILKMPKFI
jgi:hypothetical protein